MSVLSSNWVPIKEFPRYLINEYGDVFDTFKQGQVKPHQVTGGALTVRLRDEYESLYTRSVKVIVAELFVPIDYDTRWTDPTLFDTPILLDNDQLNVAASNIRMRPRWYAWKYTHQFKDFKDWYLKGPVRDFNSSDVFQDVMTAGMYYGLLFREVYRSVQEHKDNVYFADHNHWKNTGLPPQIWPTRHQLCWLE